ncbi:MAG: glycosyltransferase family 2 protein [Flavobacteriaceae bacterium]|nr:glycosyltransferase family 2 protein [Flavobacteriaceae bacterium]
MTIAIVILNWNGKALLEQFLPSIIRYTSSHASIYVADNASTDDSITFVKTQYPEVKLILNRSNGGYAKGYNDALKDLKEDLLCLLNNDIEVTPNWLSPIIESFSNSNTAIVQPKILDYKKKTHFEYAGAAGGFIDNYAYPFCRGRIFNTIEEDNHQYDNSEIFWASGACLFIRNTVFKALNGFDASFFAHMEEIDLCWRAQNLGYSVAYNNQSTVYHVGGATLSNANSQKTYLNFRNSLAMLVKNAKGNIAFLVIMRLILDGIAGIKYMLSLQPKHSYAIIKAHFAFYRRLPGLIGQRKALTQQSNYAKTPSIVWAYFIQKKKQFNRL